MADPVGCRAAAGDDVDLVTALVADAFRDDPLWSWAMRRDDGSTDHHEVLWRVFVEGALRYPCTWLAPDAAAVAVWIPPGSTEMSDDQEAELGRLADEVLGDGAARYFELFDRFADNHPHDEPHYYLSLLATDRRRRGEGIGMALLRDNLATYDALGVPTYLESSNPANDRRYASVGFLKRGEFHGPGDGPVVSTMWRPVGG
jgi:GNAT superfamily N-acetyltransferase